MSRLAALGAQQETLDVQGLALHPRLTKLRRGEQVHSDVIAKAVARSLLGIEGLEVEERRASVEGRRLDLADHVADATE